MKECINGKYLATFPLTDDLQREFSIFYSLDRFARISEVPSNDIVANLGPIIDVVVHAPSRRAGKSELASGLSEHPLLVSDPVCDVCEDDEGRRTPIADHKIGGQPFLLQKRQELPNLVEGLRHEGFLQLLQLEFIVEGDAEWSGDWPFADGLFHLFGKLPFERGDWRWLWQF